VGERPDPLLIDLPEQLATARLILRPPRPGDGPVVNAAVLESIAELQPWMPWAVPVPTAEQTELWCRKAHADFVARRQLPLLAFLRDDLSKFVASMGIPRMDWDVPWFEIGYWVRTRFAHRGYVSEAAAAITAFAFDGLRAERVEIRTDGRNERS
jgi:ribosomal-protein-serine acetyltransferase